MDIKKNLIWYEEWRPQDMSEMILGQKTTAILSSYIRKQEIPHLLFVGPPGSGKTTVSNILINNVAGKKMILNASSKDRGIDVIKENVRLFAKSLRTGKLLNVVLFDEAEGLTPQAQRALKNTIESFQSNCRFIFTCNSTENIIEPIISRCMVFNFETFPKRKLQLFLRNKLREKKIKFKPDDVADVANRYYPDIRSVINNVQFCCSSGEFKSKDMISNFEFEDLALFIEKGKIMKIRNLWKDIFDFVFIYKWLFNVWILKVEAKYQYNISIIIADYLYKDKMVASKEINMTACILEIMDVLEKEINFAKK